MLFHSWGNKVDEHSIEFAKEDIRYLSFDGAESLAWEQFKGYKVNGVFYKTFIIYGEGEKISFDFHLFDSDQRKGILAAFTERQITV